MFSVMVLTVSTHSRLKAAGNQEAHLTPLQPSFNTQPPEGGWTAALTPFSALRVSTHSRLKAAGNINRNGHINVSVSTHSRLKAAGDGIGDATTSITGVSTHSRLKAAGVHRRAGLYISSVSTHSRLKAAGPCFCYQFAY